MTDFLAEAEAVAIKAAKEAAKVLMKHFRTELRIETKGDPRNIVTIADKESDALIRKIILEKFPDHGIISEENKPVQGKSDYVWHIDPLDGTTNYSRGVSYFCVSIALAKGSEIVVGVVYNPVTLALYTAARGKGAFLNGKKLRIAETSIMHEAVICFDFGYAQDKRLQTVEILKRMVGAKSIRINGAAALTLCEIAAGLANAYVHTGGYSWDFAAGALMIHEAGGVVTDSDGKTWQPNVKEGITAGNSAITSQILAIMKK